MTHHTTSSFLPRLAEISQFAPQSRVWVYTANRPLTDAEVQTAQAALDDFARRWTAHNQALKAVAEVFQNQFILLMVDETQAPAGGCSIDTSVHFLETLGQKLGVDFFDRMRFAWVENDQLHFGNQQELARRKEQQEIRDETLMVNTLVQNKADLQEKWLVPFRQSWHRRLI